jgi:ribosomal protein L37AE/L43A
VTDTIQPAPTGRAKCRGCGKAIAKGALRFGESGPNSYGEGESLTWFHLTCAAAMRPEKLGPAMEATTESLPEREALAEQVRIGVQHPKLSRLVRAERASSGRAQCRSCRELIGKGAWRFALQIFEEGRPSPIGTIHAECAEAYFGTADVLAQAQRLTPELAEADVTELAQALSHQRPGLAKTQGAPEEEEKARDAGGA